MPPSCASAIAMSASVTVSIADDRIGILSGISRVRKVRVSAWLGSTEDSSGCNSTSSKVRPSGMSAASLSWAISAHDRPGPIRQPCLGRRPVEHALGGLDMHPLDHLITEALGAAAECLHQGPGAIHLGRARGEGTVAGFDLVGMDEALAVEAKLPPLVGFAKESVAVPEIVENAVERGDPRSARGKDDHLQRR